MAYGGSPLYMAPEMHQRGKTTRTKSMFGRHATMLWTLDTEGIYYDELAEVALAWIRPSLQPSTEVGLYSSTSLERTPVQCSQVAPQTLT